MRIIEIFTYLLKGLTLKKKKKEQKQDKMAVAKRDVKFVQTNVPRWLNGNLLLEHKSEITNPNPWLVCNKANLKPVKKTPKLCVAQKVVVKPT